MQKYDILFPKPIQKIYAMDICFEKLAAIFPTIKYDRKMKPFCIEKNIIITLQKDVVCAPRYLVHRSQSARYDILLYGKWQYIRYILIS